MDTTTTTTNTTLRKRGLMKLRQGIVSGNKMQKTVIVTVQTMKKHAAYGKFITRTTRYMAHDERSECQLGDVVQIVESRPLSKRKRWRVQRIVKRAQ